MPDRLVGLAQMEFPAALVRAVYQVSSDRKAFAVLLALPDHLAIKVHPVHLVGWAFKVHRVCILPFHDAFNGNSPTEL